MSGLTLAIDTSTARACVAVVGCRRGGNEEVTVELSGEQGNSHHEELAALTDAAFLRFGVTARELNTIVIGAGPGSFTGLRIGYAFARGLATALKVPMFGVSSLLAAAWEFRLDGRPIVAVADAGRGEVFNAIFRPNDRGLETLAPAGLVAKAALETTLRKVIGDTNAIAVVLGGEPWEGYHAPQRTALGLVQGFRAEGRTDTRPIDSEPEYLRAVAAKTIRERAAATGGGGLV